MKLSFEALMNYADAPNIQVDPISPDMTERICEMTLNKIAPKKSRSRIRPIGLLVAAAVLVTLFCGTALAAYKYGWLELLLGDSTQDLGAHITVYSPAPENTPITADPTAEPEQIDSSAVQEEPPLEASECYSVDLDDYRITLESTLAGSSSFFAIVRIEPLTDFGRSTMPLTVDDLYIVAANNSDDSGGSINCQAISSGADCAYYLVSSSGGNNQVGDIVHMEALTIYDENGREYSACLFNVEITDLVTEEIKFSLDSDAHTNIYYNFETMTVTPMSLTLDGWWDHQAFENGMQYIGDGAYISELPEPQPPHVIISLADGTIIDSSETSEYGTYGVLMRNMHGSRDTDRHWFSLTFSKAIALDEIAEITIDGVVYTPTESEKE